MNNFKEFLKRNLVYVILAFCILAIGLSVVLVMVGENNSQSNQAGVPVIKPGGGQEEQPQPEQPTDVEITFIMPVDNITGLNEYCEVPVFNSTLGIYTGHRAVDFFAPEGTEVVAVYGGKIEKIESSLLNGITVTIDHGNGLKTIYNSLADSESVFQGQTVKQGDVIGEVSTSNRQEYKDGAHLHFQVMENGNIIDPSEYLTFIEK